MLRTKIESLNCIAPQRQDALPAYAAAGQDPGTRQRIEALLAKDHLAAGGRLFPDAGTGKRGGDVERGEIHRQVERIIDTGADIVFILVLQAYDEIRADIHAETVGVIEKPVYPLGVDMTPVLMKTLEICRIEPDDQRVAPRRMHLVKKLRPVHLGMKITRPRKRETGFHLIEQGFR